jgi:hypothetical protein
LRLEDLQPDATLRGILPDALVSVVSVAWHGSDALTLVYRAPNGRVADEILYRHDEPRLELVEAGQPWSFDGDGSLFRLVAEAHRIRLAHLFDPVLAVHTSLVEPLPHQITAVYEAMLPRQPLRFLLADDPGAGKTIMAGLLIKELIARGDLKRCLVVCPGSLEQRFGRIHRIGQTEVCHLWNLVAEETREGDVYRRLLEKLEEARQALGGQVFDVLGKLQFDGRPLRDLLIEAIRYGDQPEVRARLARAIEHGVDRSHLQGLIEERALAHDAMDASRVARIREEMERAEARRLQPHYIESFFLEALERLGGTVRQREPRRYEITHVPAPVKNRDRQIGTGDPVLARYERIAFEKELIAPPGQPLAAFVCPGHPLLDAVLDLTLERHRDLLKRGTVLVDERDPATSPRVLFTLEHAIQDASVLASGERRTISRRLLYVEMDAEGNTRHLHYAPYLDYRPLAEGEPTAADLLARPECAWITRASGQSIEQRAQGHAIAHVVPEHITEVRGRRLQWIEKTRAAVKDRLTKEIAYWDHRAEQLKLQEQAGRAGARLNSQEARRRADDLQARLERRLAELDREAQISALPPVVLGGIVVVPLGLVAAMTGRAATPPASPADTEASAARARAAVMEVERALGFEPTDRELDKLGYDIESRVPGTGRLRFLEVKGRLAGADTVTVTKNEILTSLNKPDDFILALVEFLDGDTHRVRYLRRPFQREPDFGVTSVNYDFAELLARAGEPA